MEKTTINEIIRNTKIVHTKFIKFIKDDKDKGLQSLFKRNMSILQKDIREIEKTISLGNSILKCRKEVKEITRGNDRLKNVLLTENEIKENLLFKKIFPNLQKKYESYKISV